MAPRPEVEPGQRERSLTPDNITPSSPCRLTGAVSN